MFRVTIKKQKNSQINSLKTIKINSMEESKKKSAIQCLKLIEFLAYDSILIVLCLTLKSHLRDMFLLIFKLKGLFIIHL